jgi:hypothetical protein
MAYDLSDDVLVQDAREALLRDDIDGDEFEAALDHILAGGVGCERFPYLSVFRPLGDYEPGVR